MFLTAISVMRTLSINNKMKGLSLFDDAVVLGRDNNNNDVFLAPLTISIA